MINGILSFLLSSIIMSLIILVIMLGEKLFPHACPARLRYKIWIIVLIGLITPFRPVIGSGFIKLQASESRQQKTDNKEILPVTEVVTDMEAVQNSTNAGLTVNDSAGSSVSPITIGIWIWIIIANIIFIYHIWRYIRFNRMIRRWSVSVEKQTLYVFQSVQDDLGLSDKKIELKVCRFVSSSMLTGLFRPVILLPDKHFDEDELQLIFKHELIHFKRHDLFVKLLIIAATCIHWFNPIVYWMCLVMQTEGEASCDDIVLQNKDIETRRFYGEIIIGMIGNKNTVKSTLSTCFYAGKTNMKRRLDSIMDTNRKKSKTAIIGAVLVAVMTLLSGSVIVFTNITTATQTSEITVEKAGEIALAKVGGGAITGYETDTQNGRKVYDVKIVYGNKKYEMDVDAITGVITNYEVETIGADNNPDLTSDASLSGATPDAQAESDTTLDAHADSGSTPAPQSETNTSITRSAELSAEQAKEIALAKADGGMVIECKFDYEHGVQIYEIEIINGQYEYEIEINAKTGEIIKLEKECDD